MYVNESLCVSTYGRISLLAFGHLSNHVYTVQQMNFRAMCSHSILDSAVQSLARSRASGGRDQQMVAGRCLFQVLLPGALSEQLSEMDELLDEVGS